MNLIKEFVKKSDETVSRYVYEHNGDWVVTDEETTDPSVGTTYAAADGYRQNTVLHFKATRGGYKEKEV